MFESRLLLVRERIFNGRLRVVALTTAPEPAHGLLASVQHSCESGGMRLSIRDFVCGIAFDGFGIRAINRTSRNVTSPGRSAL